MVEVIITAVSGGAIGASLAYIIKAQYDRIAGRDLRSPEAARSWQEAAVNAELRQADTSKQLAEVMSAFAQCQATTVEQSRKINYLEKKIARQEVKITELQSCVNKLQKSRVD